MGDTKFEISMRKRLDKNGNPFFIANCEMDVNILETVMFAFPAPEIDLVQLARNTIMEIAGELDTPIPGGSMRVLRGILEDFYRKRIGEKLNIIIEPNENRQ